MVVTAYQRPPVARSRGSVGQTRRPRGSGGAAGSAQRGEWALSRYFGYNSSQVPPIDRPPTGGEPALVTLLQDVGAGCDPDQYVVSVTAAEQVFTVPYAATPIPPRERVSQEGPGVSELQVRLEWGMGASWNNRIELDVGAGFQFNLQASIIQVSLILPAGAVDYDAQHGQAMVDGPLDPITGDQGALHAALVYATAVRGCGYTTQSWQLTRAMVVPAGAIVRVPIPAGADFAEAWETSSPAAATPFFNFVTAEQQPTVFLDVGQWSASTAQPRRWPRSRIPGNARFIESGPVVLGAARLFIVTFTSRP